MYRNLVGGCMRLVVCTVIFSALVLGGMGFGGFPLEAFFDLPSLTWFCGALCGTVAVHPVADVFKAFDLRCPTNQAKRFRGASGVSRCLYFLSRCRSTRDIDWIGKNAARH